MAIKKAILRTLAYADLFDYPLTKDEIWKFLIINKNKKVKKNPMYETLASHLSSGKVELGLGKFFCLWKRNLIIPKRLERENESRKKLDLAQKIILRLSIIPTIKFIGISGALAMKNSDKDDDIDLFVIAKKNTLWTTRLLILVFLQFLGHRRKRTDKKVANKICVNMLLDESNLSFLKERRDLYTAHEIVQLIPLFERDGTYQKFIQSNKWIKDFLPNALKHRTKQNLKQNQTESKFSFVLRIIQLSSAMETISKAIQIWLIRRHQTIEEVSDNILAFHPLDYKKKVLLMYNKRLKEYGI